MIFVSLAQKTIAIFFRYLRLNFFTPGQTASKDIAPATSKLIEQHGHNSMFIKEMLYRSRESQRLTAAHRMIQELRKRFRQHAAKAAEEADLIPQEKLVSFVVAATHHRIVFCR